MDQSIKLMLESYKSEAPEKVEKFSVHKVGHYSTPELKSTSVLNMCSECEEFFISDEMIEYPVKCNVCETKMVPHFVGHLNESEESLLHVADKVTAIEDIGTSIKSGQILEVKEVKEFENGKKSYVFELMGFSPNLYCEVEGSDFTKYVKSNMIDSEVNEATYRKAFLNGKWVKVKVHKKRHRPLSAKQKAALRKAAVGRKAHKAQSLRKWRRAMKVRRQTLGEMKYQMEKVGEDYVLRYDNKSEVQVVNELFSIDCNEFVIDRINKKVSPVVES